MRRIGIAVKPGLTAARDTLIELEKWLAGRGLDAVWATEAAQLLGLAGGVAVERMALPKQCDLVVVLGGDGTLLALAKAIAESGHDVPILAVNFGSLGFLTETTRPEIFAALELTVKGGASFDQRMMLRAVAVRAGAPPLAERASAASRRSASSAKAEHPTVTHLALNDVVFSRTALSRMIELEVMVGDQLVTGVKADGLIVATPTGSTAYNLAAGGPIVHPSMDALLLTPIAPHTLTNRPIVIPPEREVKVRSTGSNAGDVYVTIDGQTGFGLQEGDEIAITRAERPLRLVRSTTRSYFEVLRQKLKWNER